MASKHNRIVPSQRVSDETPTGRATTNGRYAKKLKHKPDPDGWFRCKECNKEWGKYSEARKCCLKGPLL